MLIASQSTQRGETGPIIPSYSKIKVETLKALLSSSKIVWDRSVLRSH